MSFSTLDHRLESLYRKIDTKKGNKRRKAIERYLNYKQWVNELKATYAKKREATLHRLKLEENKDILVNKINMMCPEELEALKEANHRDFEQAKQARQAKQTKQAEQEKKLREEKRAEKKHNYILSRIARLQRRSGVVGPVC